ncbi:MAG: HNH endonuclease, partial [Acidobacteriota bacterium]|nr:HNH endonuclease [Acidobacteriota bacterium]
MNGKTGIVNAHKALEAKHWNIGKPNLKLCGENNPAKRPESRAKISAFKLENNWMTGRTGKLHHGYLGGKIWWRGKEWAATKLTVRESDGFKCVDCGMTEAQHIAETGQPLQVHHVIMYRISHDNSPKNLQTLCSSCHGKKASQERALIEDCRAALT